MGEGNQERVSDGKDKQGRARKEITNARKVLRSDENKLAVFHLFRCMNETLDSELSHFSIEEDVELVENTKGCLKRFSQSE